MRRSPLFVAALAFPLALTVSPAFADDTLKVAIGQMELWTNQVPTLGQRAGIFKKYGIVLENFATQGAGETLQAVISGSADLGFGVGTHGVMRAFARGAPVRIMAASFTGAGDIYWYVRADSPIQKLADATEKHTIAYSTNGATSHNVVLAYAAELGVKAKPTATGGLPATMTQVMSEQIDIGWGAAPFGLKEEKEGKIRIISTGNDAPSLRSQTVRVEVANAELLKQRYDVFLRFMRGFRETLSWMYADPQAITYYSQQFGWPEDMARLTRDRFQTKDAKQIDRISDVDRLMAEGIKLKFLDKPLSKDELSELIQIPPAGS